ncbi:hypothetical protein BC937DRAFT_92075 [Endogone sp. FLAS-F59071]|nr:hypothetical protein BC937DRAFT_92075 [Endogone sp. FLAS-F59071]|eukprot:RUS15734.1 hypothetical protein BC937DRAFT_92075 [Endogone sp. FLAS-F59071]
MKASRFRLLNKKFDDQYTFDLNGYLTRSDFAENMAKINQVVANYPLPAGMSGLFVVAGLWVLMVVGISVAWSYTQIVALFVAIPVVMVASGTGYWYITKCKRSKFERSMVDICERINATENIRGINYRFSRDGSDVADESGSSKKPMKHNYAIVIEFDDRFNIPSIQKYGKFPSEDFVSVPLFLHKSSQGVVPPRYSEKKDEEKV